MPAPWNRGKNPGGPPQWDGSDPPLRGPKRTGPIRAIVPGDDVEVAREIARLWDGLRKLARRVPIQPERGHFSIKVVADDTTVTTGDGKFIFTIPADLNGTRLKDAQAWVTTVSSSGLPTVQIRNITDAVDMLTTKVTIDASEYDSEFATTRREIDTTKDFVETGDRIAVDVDVAGTGAKGLGVHLWFS